MCSMMYDIIVFENLRFRPHENEEVAFLKKKNPLWGPFSKTCIFGARKRRLLVDGRLKRREKTLRFQKNPGTCGRGPVFT